MSFEKGTTLIRLWFYSWYLFQSGLPSAPRDLVATTTQLSAGKLLLSWNPPEDTGGRTDVTYTVECQRCEGILCQPCGEKIRYEPTSVGLTDTKVSVSELDAHLNYTFTVEAHSGVTVSASQPPSTSALTTFLHYTGECCWYEAVEWWYRCCSNDRCNLWGSGSFTSRIVLREWEQKGQIASFLLYLLTFSFPKDTEALTTLCFQILPS